jgi:uncharacterized membrane protein YkoI
MKMPSRIICILLATAIAPALVLGADKTVTLSDTPAAVQKTIAGQISDGKVNEINQTTEDGETVFEVDYTSKSGDDHDFTVSDDGTVVSVGMELSDTPEAVQKTIQAQLPGWEVTGINKNVADTEVSFDVEVNKNGQDRSFNVDNNGVLSSMDVELTNTPAAVQTTIGAQVGDGTLQSVEEDLDPDGNSFDVEALTKDGARKTFSVAPDGRLLSVGVTLEQVPPAARQTIMDKIGDGKILEIDKSLSEKRGKVLPYEVQGRKDGREFDFSVGPRGRFLGMDE